MNLEEFLSVRSRFPDDTIDELRRARAGNRLFDKEICEYKKLVEEDNEMDESYKKLFLCLVNMDENFGPRKELWHKDEVNERGADYVSEEENDPQYEHFLKHLREHYKFYALEYEKEGVRVVHKYGEDSDSEEEWDPEPWRKRKRAMKRKIVTPNQRRLTWSQVKNKVDKVETMIGWSPDLVLESHKECGPELGKKVNKTRKQKVGSANQMPDVENWPFNAVEMTTRLPRGRTKLANEVEAENMKGSPDMVLVSHRRKLTRVVQPKMGPSNQMSDVENQFYALEYEKDGVHVVRKYGEDSDWNEKCDLEPTRKWRRATKQKIASSNQRCLTWSQVTNKVEKMENVEGSPDVLLDSHKECDPELLKKVNSFWKQKVGPSNQMLNVENQPSLKMTTCLTRSRRKLENVAEIENIRGSLDVVLVSHRRKMNRVAKLNMGPLNQMSDVPNQRERDRQPNSVKRTRVTKKKSTNEGDNVKNMKALPNDMVPDLQYHYLYQNVKLEDGHYGYMNKDKQFAPESQRRANAAQKQKVGKKRKHDHWSCSLKKTKCLTKRKVKHEAETAYNDEDRLNAMVLDLHEKHDSEPRRKLNQDTKRTLRPSNQMPDVEKNWKHVQLSCSLKKTKGLIKRKVELDGLNAMMLDSYKECDSEPRRELNRATKQTVEPSNQIPDVDKKPKHDQLSCSLQKTRGLTKRKVKLEVGKVYRERGTPNDMVLNSNKECDLQPRRKVDRATNQKVGPSNQMPAVENKHKVDQKHNSLKKKKGLTRRILTDEVKVENMKDYSPIDLASYPEYVDLDDYHDGYMHKGSTVANDEKNHGLNDVKKQHEDNIDSDVEILDSEAIIEGGILSAFVPSKRVHYSMQEHLRRSSEDSEFRKQVLNVLGKPFDKKEYMRHQKAAKCYLDHHPDLRRKLTKYRYNQGKRLTIYRGFFFWLQNLTQEGSFRPWTDRECLAVEPTFP